MLGPEITQFSGVAVGGLAVFLSFKFINSQMRAHTDTLKELIELIREIKGVISKCGK